MRTSFLAVLVIAALLAPADAQRRDTGERRVVVSVLDRAGKVAAGLTPADFVVREDGVAREITKVEQSAAPMQIAVLVDTAADMQITLRDVRLGVQAFSRAIWATNADSDLALVEFGQRPNHLVTATRSAETLKGGIDRLFEHPGSGAYLLDAVVEATLALKARSATRPVLVVLSRESTPEFSTRQSGPIEATVRNAQAQLWTLVLRDGQPAESPVDSPLDSNEARQRDIVLGDVAARSGGAREILLTRMAIQVEFERLAERLAAQYVVTYARPESLIPPSKLEVTGRRAGTRVLAPRWTGQ